MFYFFFLFYYFFFFFGFVFFFCFQRQSFSFYSSTLQLMLVPFAGRKMSSHTSPHCRLYFHFFWDQLAYCGIIENGVLLMYMLEGVGSVANFNTAYEESQ